MIKEYQLQKKQNSFEVTLHYKGVKVRVAFTGGNVYKGTMPRFRTNDLFKMKAIEASELFRTKEVVALRTIQEAISKSPVVMQRKRVGKPAGTRVAQGVKLAHKPTPTPQDPPVEENESKEFSNLGEAILFIAQNYQTQVKTEKEARDILKANGINPVIHKG